MGGGQHGRHRRPRRRPQWPRGVLSAAVAAAAPVWAAYRGAPAYCLPRTAYYCEVGTADCSLLTAYCSLLTTYYLLLTTHYLLLTTRGTPAARPARYGLGLGLVNPTPNPNQVHLLRDLRGKRALDYIFERGHTRLARIARGDASDLEMATVEEEDHAQSTARLGSADWSLPERGSCASLGCAWRLRAARDIQGERPAHRLLARPPPCLGTRAGRLYTRRFDRLWPLRRRSRRRCCGRGGCSSSLTRSSSVTRSRSLTRPEAGSTRRRATQRRRRSTLAPRPVPHIAPRPAPPRSHRLASRHAPRPSGWRRRR